MNKIYNNSHLIFWFSIPILLLIRITSNNQDLDINVHDTYIVFQPNELIIIISLLFGVIGIVYWLLKKLNRKLSKWLSLIHIFFTIGGILLIWILSHFFNESPLEYEINDKIRTIIYIIVLLSIFGQIVFPINILIALLSKRNKITN